MRKFSATINPRNGYSVRVEVHGIGAMDLGPFHTSETDTGRRSLFTRDETDALISTLQAARAVMPAS